MNETENRQKVIVRTSIIGIAANIVLSACKAFVGFATNSIAVTLDAVNNLSDALSSVITIVGAKLSNKLPDKKHPLGYGRIEYLSAMVVAAIVLYAGGTSAVESVKKGRAGEPGQLRGAVRSQTPAGSLRSNTAFGVFGSGAKWPGEALPIAAPEEVRTGAARIMSNISGDEVAFFDVEITKCSHSRNSGRDLLIHVTDPALLNATGGIVAGMSGSPIIQDGRLVGAVTHVCVFG